MSDFIWIGKTLLPRWFMLAATSVAILIMIAVFVLAVVSVLDCVTRD